MDPFGGRDWSGSSAGSHEVLANRQSDCVCSGCISNHSRPSVLSDQKLDNVSRREELIAYGQVRGCCAALPSFRRASS